MKSIASRLSFLLTASLLAAGLLLLVVGRLDYCGRIEAPQPPVSAMTTFQRAQPDPRASPESGLRPRRGRQIGHRSRLAG